MRDPTERGVKNIAGGGAQARWRAVGEKGDYKDFMENYSARHDSTEQEMDK